MSKRLVIVQDETGCNPRYVSFADLGSFGAYVPTEYDPKPIKLQLIKNQLLNPREHRTHYPDFLKTRETPTSMYYDRSTLNPQPIKEPYVIGVEKQC